MATQINDGAAPTEVTLGPFQKKEISGLRMAFWLLYRVIFGLLFNPILYFYVKGQTWEIRQGRPGYMFSGSNFKFAWPFISTTFISAILLEFGTIDSTAAAFATLAAAMICLLVGGGRFGRFPFLVTAVASLVLAIILILAQTQFQIQVTGTFGKALLRFRPQFDPGTMLLAATMAAILYVIDTVARYKADGLTITGDGYIPSSSTETSAGLAHKEYSLTAHASLDVAKSMWPFKSQLVSLVADNLTSQKSR